MCRHPPGARLRPRGRRHIQRNLRLARRLRAEGACDPVSQYRILTWQRTCEGQSTTVREAQSEARSEAWEGRGRRERRGEGESCVRKCGRELWGMMAFKVFARRGMRVGCGVAGMRLCRGDLVGISMAWIWTTEAEYPCLLSPMAPSSCGRLRGIAFYGMRTENLPFNNGYYSSEARMADRKVG
jgi:hypothetical protein